MTKFIDCSNEAKEEKKETVFTHFLCGRNGWVNCNGKPTNFEEVRYIGKCKVDGDMFACYENGGINIYKGIKGSEFD